MAYSGVIDLIRTTAEGVNPTGTFVHARRTDGSLEYEGAMPQIHLYPLNEAASIVDAYTSTYSVLMAFWFQDAFDSTNEDREGLINQADTLARAFILALDSDEQIEIANLRTEPNYRQLSGTLTGLIVQFDLTITTDVCSTS